jgi:hypothetical protein
MKTDNFCFCMQSRQIHSKLVKQEVNGAVILSRLVFPGISIITRGLYYKNIADSKAACLSKHACLYKLVFITVNRKANGLLENLAIFRKL